MSDIFVSYSRADATRVGRLVRALKGAGLSLWWDRGIPGGENWREQIQIALDAARCVIVVWTHASVGEAGGFVRDEATQAMRRGVMVPVMLDKVDLPLGFGEIQAIDLTRWRGRRRDPFFIDLCTAVTAKLEGRAVPPAKGPLKRLLRRARYGSLASAMVLCALAFGFDLYDAQEHACGVSLLQPQVSDVCGKFGLGDRPTRSERIAWEGRELGSCPALRAHIERFPQGVYRDEAANLLTARRVTQVETWKPVVHR